MNIQTEILKTTTKGQNDIINITPNIQALIQKHKLKEGNVTAFVVGSTASLSTIEFEPGLIKDMQEVYEKIAPRHQNYAHHNTWHDDNGSSHVRATIQGPSLTIPFVEGELTLGTWQQIILLEFDTRSRSRKVIVQLIGN